MATAPPQPARPRTPASSGSGSFESAVSSRHDSDGHSSVEDRGRGSAEEPQGATRGAKVRCSGPQNDKTSLQMNIKQSMQLGGLAAGLKAWVYMLKLAVSLSRKTTTKARRDQTLQIHMLICAFVVRISWHNILNITVHHDNVPVMSTLIHPTFI